RGYGRKPAFSCPNPTVKAVAGHGDSTGKVCIRVKEASPFLPGWTRPPTRGEWNTACSFDGCTQNGRGRSENELPISQGDTIMELQTLRDLFVHELKDL